MITSFTSFPELPIAQLSRGVTELRQRGASRDITRWLSRPTIVYGDPAPTLNPPRPIPGTHLVSPLTHHPKPHPKSINLSDAEALGKRGKNLHVSRSLELLNQRETTFNRAVLMDDDPHNIELADRYGHLTIPVSRDLNDHQHLDLWRALSETLTARHL